MVSVLHSSLWDRYKQNPLSMLGLCVASAILILALTGPLISGYNYYEIDLVHKNEAPSLDHWFGTDDLGRDVFTRVWYGARISLFIGISAALIDMLIGIIWGGISALAGGIVDDIMMRLVDILYALPYLLVVILISIISKQGILSILIAMTFIGWITMARIVRGQILQLKQEEYVQAATALGAGFGRILFVHLLPNAMGPIIVTLTLTIPSAIFTEAFLSFLGLGVQAPVASWGTMANEGLPALTYYPWRMFFPAFCISLTMLAFNLVGEGLRDAMSPFNRYAKINKAPMVNTQ